MVAACPFVLCVGSCEARSGSDLSGHRCSLWMSVEGSVALGDSGILSSPDRDQENLDPVVKFHGLLGTGVGLCVDLMFYLL